MRNQIIRHIDMKRMKMNVRKKVQKKVLLLLLMQI